MGLEGFPQAEVPNKGLQAGGRGNGDGADHPGKGIGAIKGGGKVGGRDLPGSGRLGCWWMTGETAWVPINRVSHARTPDGSSLGRGGPGAKEAEMLLCGCGACSCKHGRLSGGGSNEGPWPGCAPGRRGHGGIPRGNMAWKYCADVAAPAGEPS